ncbi:MAG: peptidoglycan-associated lipoprotein Pal [Gemmatimonadota bacterium]
MPSVPRKPVVGPALLAILVFALVADGCSRRRAPETDVTTTTGGADTTAMAPAGETDRAADVMADRIAAARATISERIYFDFNRSEVRADSRDVLARKVDAMNELPEIAIRIEGHADERGTVEYNLALGERRAQAAKDYLVNAGIDPSRITTISYGEEQPAIDESNESAWAENRRYEFVITSAPGEGF